MSEPVSSAVSQPNVKVETGGEWQRLALISILYFTVRNISNAGQGLIYAGPALAVSFNIWDNLFSPEVLAVAGFLLLSTGGSGVISFLMYKFRVHNQHVEIHHGVFQRRYTNLPLWRIQNVKIERPFYYRPFGYALVVLDTAGSGKEEAKIVAVPESYAEALKKQVLYEKKAHDSPSPERTISYGDSQGRSMSGAEVPILASAEHRNDATEEVLNRRSVKDIIIQNFEENLKYNY